LTKNPLIYSVSYFNFGGFVALGLVDAQQWIQRLTFDGYCDEQLYSVQPLSSCTTISINALFNKSVNHNHI